MSWIKLFIIIVLLGIGLAGASFQDEVWLYGGGTFGPDDEINLEYSISKAAEAKLKIFKIKNPEKILEFGGPRYFENADKLNLKKIRELKIKSSNDNRWGDIKLGKLKVGMYFAQLESAGSKSANLILVTDLSLVVKTDSDSMLLYSANKFSGKPVDATIYYVSNKKIEVKTVASNGVATMAIGKQDESNDKVVAANYKDSWAFSASYWRSWAMQKTKTYVQTDRPVYRPGHTVHIKTTTRSAAGLKPIAGEKIKITIRDANYDEIFSDTFKTDEYGSATTELILSVEPPLGSYQILTELDGEQSYANFFVEEFQKPEYKVDVKSDKEKIIQGEDVNFEVSAEYLFGGAVSGGKVNYALLKEPFYYWGYRYYYEDFYSGGYRDSEVVERGEAVLDENGKLVLSFKSKTEDYDYKYSLQVGVVDEARREISASASTTVFRSGLVINVSSDSYAYKEGDKVLLTVETNDIYGNAVSADFKLDIKRYYWYENDSHDEKVVSKSGRTSAKGEAIVEFEAGKQGSYYITVSAKDKNNRKTQAFDYFWVSGSSRWYWAYDSLNIKADKDEYKVGDIAKFVIQSPVADAYALVSQEGQAIADYELVKINGSVLTYEMKITDDMTPNSFLSVVIIGDGKTYSETAGFNVPPIDKYLNVEINSDSDLYEPGQEGAFTLRVSDISGKGVKAQVAVGIVDEGIYLIRPETNQEIKSFFYSYRSNIVSTEVSDWYYFGQAEAFADTASVGAVAPMAKMVERSMMNEAVFGQDKGGFAPATVREDFRDTILWLPLQETDENGLAEITVKFPDNLTEWRLTARAISQTDKVGQNTYSVKTSLPVIARLAMPRFFVRGDEASLRVIGQNNLDGDLLARIKLATTGLLVTDPLESPAILPAGGRATADFRVIADKTGLATVLASVETSEASDAMKMPVPVLAHGIKDSIAWASSNSDVWSFDLPATTDFETLNASLYITPSLAAAVSPALSYLAGYPYGCTEQTMSRFYPSVLASQAGGLAKLPDDVLENLDDMVAKGLKRIYDFQHDDGGWGFWKHDDSSLFITSYVINGLVDAKKAGYRTQDWAFERALEYLSIEVQNKLADKDYYYRVVDADARAYAYYALARAGMNIDGLGVTVAAKDMTSYGLALSVLAFAEAGRKVEANLYLDELLSKISEHETVAFFKTTGPKYYWNDDQLETTAYALNAMALVRPNDPLIAKMVNWILLERKGSRWHSTKDTAAIVKAALDLAKATNEEAKDLLITAKLNGKEVLSTHIKGQSSEGIKIDLDGLTRSANKLEINTSGTGVVYTSANVEFFAEQESFKAEGDDLKVERNFERLVPVFDKRTQSYSYKAKPLNAPSEVGDYILVTVTLKPQDSFRYVIVNEPLPAGYRVVENDQIFKIAGKEPRYGWDYYGWNYWYDGRDVRDERVDYYFSYLGEEVTFTYILRAETPGKYTALPTQAWLMYSPEIRSNSTDRVLEIK